MLEPDRHGINNNLGEVSKFFVTREYNIVPLLSSVLPVTSIIIELNESSSASFNRIMDL